MIKGNPILSSSACYDSYALHPDVSDVVMEVGKNTSSSLSTR